jgi:excisionase family DNA binding protein
MQVTTAATPQPPPPEKPMDIHAAAAYLNGMHPKTLETMARNGELPAAKVGRHWMFLRSLLDEWLRNKMLSNLTNRAGLTESEQ